MKKKTKRVIVIADKHCGHKTGLTLPKWDNPTYDPEMYEMRREIAEWYIQRTKQFNKPDVLIVNGDCIDGRGERSGSTELLYVDRTVQCKMAVDAIKLWDAKAIFMSYGTPYHTGQIEDWEDVIAKDVGAVKIGGEDIISVNGVIINYRHHVARSSIPHGRHTALAREKLWNTLWKDRGEYPGANIIIRSHVHYHSYAGGAGWVAMTTPALQGYGGKYGGRIVSGAVDIGIVIIEIESDGGFTWRAPILRLPLEEPISL